MSMSDSHLDKYPKMTFYLDKSIHFNYLDDFLDSIILL